MASNTGKVQCVACKGWYRRKQDNQPYKHACDPVSDPAPTVEETTHLGNGVHGGLETHKGAKENCPGPDCGPTTEGDDVADKGPWFGAMYEGRCSMSECRIEEGDRIRADGQGGYECEDCGVAETILRGAPDESGDWQAQASAAAKRHVAAQTAVGGASHCVSGRCVGCCGCSSMCTDTPCGQPVAAMYSEPTEEAVTDAMPFADPAPVTAAVFTDPAGLEAAQPVLGVNGQPKKVRRDHMKRYAVVLPGETELETYPTSGKPKGRTRATTFNKAATDKKNINDWGKRNVVIGASRRRDLLLQAHGLTHEHDRDRLNAIVVELEEAAGAKVGSDLGTYLHEFTEYIDAGLKTPEDAPEEFRKSLRAYVEALADAGLEPIRNLIERTTIIREYGWVCGTFDRIFYHRPSGQYVIGDLKTGQTMDYGKNEVETQLWIYAHGVNQNGVYDWLTDKWGSAVEDPLETDPEEIQPITVSETVGVVIHMPVQGPKEGTVSLLWADLEAGAQHAELCHAVRSQPKGKMRPWGDGPAPLAPPSWEDRFRAVRSNEEASALWRKAKTAGITGRHLEEYIDLARQSLRLISFGRDVRG